MSKIYKNKTKVYYGDIVLNTYNLSAHHDPKH